MALILEVLDARPGPVQTRLRLERAALPLTIGRGYGNDLILDDPYVDARHARLDLDADGALVVEDLGSVNGLASNGTPRLARIVVHPGTAVRIGRTTLRFRDADEPVPPALPDWARAAPLAGHWITGTGARLAVIVAACTVLAVDSWLESFENSSAGNALTTLLAMLVLAAAWAGAWSLAGRIVTQRFRFDLHLVVILAAAAVLTLLSVAEQWAQFLAPDAAAPGVVGALLTGALLATLVAAHLAIASTMPRRRCWRVGVITSAVVFAGFGAVALVEQDSFSDVPEFSSAVKPVSARRIPTGTLEQFGAAAAKVRAEVDALAEE